MSRRPRILLPATLALLLQTGSAYGENFGAIAYSVETGAWGTSYDYRSRSQAEAEALGRCQASGADCSVVVWFRNACGAFAVGEGGGNGHAWASSRRRAEAEAIRHCTKGADACRVVAWSCTSI